MNDKDKIYELFRRNEHKLSERPPSRAWERLEGKLDGHFRQRQRRISRLRYGAMAAAVLALVVVASVLMIQMPNTADNAAPQFATTDLETSLMDMPMDKEDDSNYLRIVQYQKEYHRDFAHRIVETSNTQGTLKSRNKSKTQLDNDTYDSAIAYNDLSPEEESSPRTNTPTSGNSGGGGKGFSGLMDKIFGGREKAAAEEPEPIAQVDFAEDDMIEITEELNPGPIIEAEEAMAIPKPSSSYHSKKEEKAKDAPTRTAAGGGATPTAPSAAPAKEVATESGVDYQMNDQAAENYTAEILDAKESSYTTQLFDWLVGSWQQNINGNQSKEVWKRKNRNTLIGQGYLKVNGKTVFSERMEIHKSQGQVFMTIKLDEDKGRVSYRLTNHSGRKAVFENTNIDFPSQLVLYQNSKDEFTITLQNGSESLDSKQKEFIQNRNQIMPQKIQRNLKRVSMK